MIFLFSWEISPLEDALAHMQTQTLPGNIEQETNNNMTPTTSSKINEKLGKLKEKHTHGGEEQQQEYQKPTKTNQREKHNTNLHSEKPTCTTQKTHNRQQKDTQPLDMTPKILNQQTHKQKKPKNPQQ